jgi:hypothetical protein
MDVASRHRTIPIFFPSSAPEYCERKRSRYQRYRLLHVAGKL